MQSVTEFEKGIVQRDRSYHTVPADWARHGTHATVPADYDRFYAEAVCYEHRLERDDDATFGVLETHRLYVLYRHPATGEAVERAYDATVIETERGHTIVNYGNGRPAGEWVQIQYAGVTPRDGVLVLPRAVYTGEPANFRASIAVHPGEERVDG